MFCLPGGASVVPLRSSNLVLEIAAAVDCVATTIVRATVPVNELINLLAAPDSTSHALCEKIKAPSIPLQRLEFNRLNNLCRNIDGYLAKHVVSTGHQVQMPASDDEMMAETPQTFRAFKS